VRGRSGPLKPLPKIKKSVSVNKMNISFAMVYLIIIRGTQKTLKNRQSKTNKIKLQKTRQISNTDPTINVGILVSTGVRER
jgi:hypothetical protein